jgi:hypothetical protein
MNCPHCNHHITDETIAAHMGKKGGARSKRKITPEQQAKMQEARKRKSAD